MAGEELSFSSPEELFDALAAPDAMARRRVLGWVATHPSEAIALGPVDGRDVLEVLFGLINRAWSYEFWQDVAITIGVFDSTRVTEFFLDLLATADGSAQAYDAAGALARRRGAPGVRERAIEIVTGEGPPERLAAAAQLLAAEPDLPDGAAIRISLVEDEVDPPRIDERTARLWVSELGGPFGEQARDRLRAQGPDALRALADRWEDLDGEDRTWLLEWASEAQSGEPPAPDLVRRGLRSGDDEVALGALRCAVTLPVGAVDDRDLEPWAAHGRATVRAAAIAAGAPADLTTVLRTESEPEVLSAALARLAAEGAPDASGAIAAHLGSESLEVRNAARDAMVALGPAAVDRLRPLVHSDSAETRAAAVRALLDLEDDDWLAAELLERPDA